MTKCIRKSLDIVRTILLLSCTLLMAGVISHAQLEHRDLGVLRVVSIQKIGDNDPQRERSDYLGANVRIRLRFEAPRESSIYVYAPAECPPEGYVLERKNGVTVWLASLKKGNASVSPGFADLKSELGDGWIFLPPGAAMEWNVDTEPTPVGVQRARSVFVSKRKGSAATEVLSEWFETKPPDSSTTVPHQ
ncbi:MAG: hypothetical protein ABSC64_08785 [Candidatus Korobacteraceae bacterium]|jgi:hypothetical protein